MVYISEPRQTTQEQAMEKGRLGCLESDCGGALVAILVAMNSVARDMSASSNVSCNTSYCTLLSSAFCLSVFKILI